MVLSQISTRPSNSHPNSPKLMATEDLCTSCAARMHKRSWTLRSALSLTAPCKLKSMRPQIKSTSVLHRVRYVINHPTRKLSSSIGQKCPKGFSTPPPHQSPYPLPV